MLEALTDDCLEWPYFRNEPGYGEMSFNGGRERVHRVSYELTTGTIPDGVWVLHKCDNPPCFNPKHLYLGTVVDNSRDQRERNRTARGTKNAHHKLTEDQIREIRATYKYGVTGFGHLELGRKFGVKRETIRDIVTGRTWKWLDQEKSAA